MSKRSRTILAAAVTMPETWATAAILAAFPMGVFTIVAALGLIGGAAPGAVIRYLAGTLSCTAPAAIVASVAWSCSAAANRRRLRKPARPRRRMR